MHYSTRPTFVVIDIYDLMVDFAKNRSIYGVYRYFPLDEMIQCILMVNAYEDNGEHFWTELDQRCENFNSDEVLNYDTVSFFYELLCEYLDQYITSKLPKGIEYEELIFHEWVNTTTIILQKGVHACDRNSLM